MGSVDLVPQFPDKWEWSDGCFLEIYFGFSIHILYFWGKRGIKKPKVHVTLCSRTAAQFGESKSVLCTVWPQTRAQCLDVVMMSRLGGVEGEEQTSCAHPAAGSQL